MTSLRQQATQMLSESLSEEFDSCLTSEGFSRKANSLRYSRQVADGVQSFEISFNIRDVYVSGAAAHVLPRLSVVFPKLNELVVAMVGNDPHLIASTRVTFSEDLANIAPRELWELATRWFVVDQESADECVVSIRDVFEQWCLPFLNRYTTVAALVEGFEQQDEHLRQDRRFWLFIVAAYTLLNQPAKAMQLLESKFGRPGARREYAKAYEYVGDLLDR